MRYFYTDPLAAAWMAKHFGMQYVSPINATFDWSKANSYSSRNGNWMIPGDRLIIHPASLKLLEPMVGDIGINDDGRTGSYRAAYERRSDKIEMMPEISVPAGFYERLAAIGEARIIQRNGIAFMWPEVGE